MKWLKNIFTRKGTYIKQSARGNNVTQIAVIGNKKQVAYTKIDKDDKEQTT